MTIWTIILAAGTASRFGSCKALAPWHDETLLARAVSAAPERDRTIVVSGAYRLETELPDIPIIHNPDWPDGIGTSIAAGLKYVSAQDADIALILPVDQPFVPASHLSALAALALDRQRCILTQDGGIQGPPAAIPARFFPALTAALGQNGLKSVLTDFDVHEGAGMLRDIDTPDDLQQFTTMPRTV